MGPKTGCHRLLPRLTPGGQHLARESLLTIHSSANILCLLILWNKDRSAGVRKKTQTKVKDGEGKGFGKEKSEQKSND